MIWKGRQNNNTKYNTCRYTIMFLEQTLTECEISDGMTDTYEGSILSKKFSWTSLNWKIEKQVYSPKLSRPTLKFPKVRFFYQISMDFTEAPQGFNVSNQNDVSSRYFFVFDPAF